MDEVNVAVLPDRLAAATLNIRISSVVHYLYHILIHIHFHKHPSEVILEVDRICAAVEETHKGDLEGLSAYLVKILPYVRACYLVATRKDKSLKERRVSVMRKLSTIYSLGINYNITNS